MENTVIIDLPEGLTQRPATIDDIDVLLELIGSEEHDEGEVVTDREDIEMGFDRAGHDPARDSVLVADGARPAARASGGRSSRGPRSARRRTVRRRSARP